MSIALAVLIMAVVAPTRIAVVLMMTAAAHMIAAILSIHKVRKAIVPLAPIQFTVIRSVQGVESVSVDLQSGIATVTGDGFSDDAVKEAVESIGFTI